MVSLSPCGIPSPMSPWYPCVILSPYYHCPCHIPVVPSPCGTPVASSPGTIPLPVVSLFVLSLLSSFGPLNTCLGYSAASVNFTIGEFHASKKPTHRQISRIGRIDEFPTIALVVARHISRIVEFHASVNFTHRQVSRIGEFHASANVTHRQISRITNNDLTLRRYLSPSAALSPLAWEGHPGVVFFGPGRVGSLAH